ncbi:hypothetical protein ACW6B7_001843 [Aeromonas veronii]
MPRYTVEISDKVVGELDDFASRHHISRAEAARRAFALLALAEKEAAKGNSLGIVKEEDDHLRAIGRVVGV